MTLRIFIKIFGLALLEPVLDQNLYYVGNKLTSASFSSALVNILPAITFIMAIVLRMEKLLLSEIVNHGKLVSDEMIINLLSKRLEEGEGKGELGFILDGFPRTIRQAEILEGVTDIDLVINLKLREEALLAKCVGRRKRSQCGGNFNVSFFNDPDNMEHLKRIVEEMQKQVAAAGAIRTKEENDLEFGRIM
ncbi:putative adenylate kinase 1, chloroplastic [Hordeum vulgare]|nr:putative adenylate kinase 1, chloroplastic [Hordeum vulgare]